MYINKSNAYKPQSKSVKTQNLLFANSNTNITLKMNGESRFIVRDASEFRQTSSLQI